jgi:hypothetical protein
MDGTFTKRESCTAKKSRTGDAVSKKLPHFCFRLIRIDQHHGILGSVRAARRSHERSRRSKIDLDAAEATVTLDYR